MNTNVLNDSVKNLDIEKVPHEDRIIAYGVSGIVAMFALGVSGIYLLLK